MITWFEGSWPVDVHISDVSTAFLWLSSLNFDRCNFSVIWFWPTKYGYLAVNTVCIYVTKCTVFLIIIITKLILLKIRISTVKFQIVVLSQTRHSQWRVPNEQWRICLQNTYMLICLCLWEFIEIKHVTDSDVLPLVYLKFYSSHFYF
jgi:hypothetical protein